MKETKDIKEMRGVEDTETKRKWNWSATLLVVILHIASLYAIAYGVMHGFSLGSWMLFGIFNFATILGVSVGYHRFITHSSFECIWPLQLLFLACGMASKMRCTSN